MTSQPKPKQKDIKGIPDELWLEAKALAARRGITLGKYVAEALEYMNAITSGKKPKR